MTTDPNKLIPQMLELSKTLATKLNSQPDTELIKFFFHELLNHYRWQAEHPPSPKEEKSNPNGLIDNQFKLLINKFVNKCNLCQKTVDVNQPVLWDVNTKKIIHTDCLEKFRFGGLEAVLNCDN